MKERLPESNHAIRSERYHYIRYRDGGEELYDMASDPNQWKNLATRPAHAGPKAALGEWLPTTNAEHFSGGGSRLNAADTRRLGAGPGGG
ncbi:MAG: hypothetical protein VX288_05335 [Planctomycetota bacterium]|nr:hypothetical protein [Planctomycetota bacterium]